MHFNRDVTDGSALEAAFAEHLARCGTLDVCVVNAGVRQGLEGWRALVLHHEPPSKVQAASLLLDLLSYSFDGDINYRLVLFDIETNRYQSQSGEGFSGEHQD